MSARTPRPFTAAHGSSLSADESAPARGAVQAPMLFAVYLAVLLSVLSGVSMRGAKMLVSLSALSIGATPFQVGLLAAMFAAFPLILAVYVGKLSDRIGMRRPIVVGAIILATGTAVPLVMPGLSGLLLCSALIGLGHVFFHVSMHNLIGAYGEGEARTRNFATFSLGASTSAFIGPSLAGFTIDSLGFASAYLVLAAIAIVPAIVPACYRALIPQRLAHTAREATGGSLALIGNPGLRRTLLMSGVTLTGIELFTFYLPVYGRSVGLTASAIGVVMSSYAVAAFLVRTGMHRATRRIGELGVLTASLFVSGLTYLLVPLVSSAPLLALVSFLIGIGLGCAQPLTILLTYNHAPPGRSGEALGMRIMVNKLTQISVPIVFGGLGTAFGLAPVFWADGAFLLVGGLLSLADRPVLATRDASTAVLAEQQEEDA